MYRVSVIYRLSSECSSDKCFEFIDGLNGRIGRNLNIHQTLHCLTIFLVRNELNFRRRSPSRIILLFCHLLLLSAKLKPLSSAQ